MPMRQFGNVHMQRALALIFRTIIIIIIVMSAIVETLIISVVDYLYYYHHDFCRTYKTYFVLILWLSYNIGIIISSFFDKITALAFNVIIYCLFIIFNLHKYLLQNLLFGQFYIFLGYFKLLFILLIPFIICG